MTEDLWNALAEVSGENIEHIMSTWTKQTGFPVLTVRPVSFDPKTSLTISIEQNRFLADGTEDGEWWTCVKLLFFRWPNPNLSTKVVLTYFSNSTTI